AKRVVLDTIEVLFASLPNEAILRAELRRLFRWLKDKGVTAIITAERGRESFTRHGLEEYVADCVILLDHRVNEQISTRRLRVVKYRGSWHGTNEYPFLISDEGISVMPVTSIGRHVGRQRVLPGQQRPDFRFRRDGQNQSCGCFRGGGGGPGRTLSLLRLRGIREPVHAQHAIHRPRFGAVCKKRAAPVPCLASESLRLGDAPAHHPGFDQKMETQERGD